MSLRQISERERELLAMDPVMRAFPVQFSVQSVWERMSGECKSCGKEILDEDFRGQVTRPIPSVAVVEAVGVCRHCNVLTAFLYRLHDDMRITGPRDGKWLTWKSDEKPWWKKLLGRLMG